MVYRWCNSIGQTKIRHVEMSVNQDEVDIYQIILVESTTLKLQWFVQDKWVF